MARRILFTLAITACGIAGILHALVMLTLTTRPRLEAWQARHAGTGLYPRPR